MTSVRRARRGWLLLALASLPGTLALGWLVRQWMAYPSRPSVAEFVGAASALVLVLCLTPPVRRWSRRRPAAAGKP